jgi:hypothetical protein
MRTIKTPRQAAMAKARAEARAMWQESDLRKLAARGDTLCRDFEKSLQALLADAYMLGLERARRNKNEAEQIRNYPEQYNIK